MTLLIVVAFAAEASARHRKPVRKNSFPDVTTTFTESDRFTCRWKEKPEHGYVCQGDKTDGANEFTLNAALNAGPTPRDQDVTDQSTLAVPDVFSCVYTGDPAADRTVNHFSCTYRHKHSPRGAQHIHRFLLSQVVLVTLENYNGSVWVLPHPSTKAHAGKPRPVKKAHGGKAHAVTTVHRGKAYHAKKAHVGTAHSWKAHPAKRMAYTWKAYPSGRAHNWHVYHPKKAYGWNAYHARRSHGWQAHYPCRGR